MNSSPRRVSIIEVGPRDGLQSEPEILSTAAKIEFIRRAIDAGVRALEVTSFVHPKRVPQMADAEAVISGLPKRDDVHYIGLVLNHKGFERARDAGLGEIGMAVVASDTYNQRNQGVPTRESVKAWLDIAREARAAGMRANVMISSAFGCPFEGEIPLARVLSLVDEVLEGEPVELGIADSIGVGVPAQVTEMIRSDPAARARGMPIRCHFHNTRNTGLANAQAALDAGVASLDASIGGIGGLPVCAGRHGQYSDRRPAVYAGTLRCGDRRVAGADHRDEQVAAAAARAQHARHAAEGRYLPQGDRQYRAAS